MTEDKYVIAWYQIDKPENISKGKIPVSKRSGKAICAYLNKRYKGHLHHYIDVLEATSGGIGTQELESWFTVQVKE